MTLNPKCLQDKSANVAGNALLSSVMHQHISRVAKPLYEKLLMVFGAF